MGTSPMAKNGWANLTGDPDGWEPSELTTDQTAAMTDEQRKALRVLGIPIDSITEKLVKERYRVRIKAAHPDSAEVPADTERITALTDAKDVLLELLEIAWLEQQADGD